MTYTEARDAIVAYLNPAWIAGYPGVRIFYENTVQIDLDTVGNNFLAVSIDFDDNMRMGVDLSPVSRSEGVVTLRLFSKEGQGTRIALQMMDWLTALMKYRTLSGGLTLDCPKPGPKQSRDGWTSSDLSVPFSFFQ